MICQHALALLQVPGSKDPPLFATVLAVSAVYTGLLLLTRPAGLLRHSIHHLLTQWHRQRAAAANTEPSVVHGIEPLAPIS